MKMRLWNLLLVTMLIGIAMTGCRAGSVGQSMQSVRNTAEAGAEAAADSRLQSSEPAAASTRPANPVLTPEEAQQIALKHAGLTAGQVVSLHSDYEIEYGTPIYDVEFHHRAWQFDYEIHADTGEILSFSKDD